MSPKGKKNRKIHPEPEPDELAWEEHPEGEEIIPPPPAPKYDGKNDPDWCSRCDALARPTKDGKHKCQCRREKR